MKAPSKRQESDIYEQIRKLAAAGSNSKDLYDLENLFKTQIYSSASQRSSTLSSKSSCNSNLSEKDTPSKIEDLFYKESHCKDVNFSHEDKENKVPSIKPIIVSKKTCALHGDKHTPVAPRPPSVCKVHGHQSSPVVKEIPEKIVKATQQPKQSPPAYRYPPKVNPRYSLDEQVNQFVRSGSFDTDSLSEVDAAGSTFTCPEFLTNLILPSEEPETQDILAAVGVQSAKGKICFIA